MRSNAPEVIQSSAMDCGPAVLASLLGGFGASVSGIVVYRGLQLGLFDSIMGLNPYRKDLGWKGIVSGFIAAQVAGVVARPFNYPFDTVRRRLQMQSEKPKEEWIYKGTGDCFGKIMKEEGFTAFFKGAGANALRTVGSALVLVLYGEIKEMMK